VPEWPEKEKLANEKEVLGFYLTSHPLTEHADLLATFCTHSTANIGTATPRSEVILGGILASLKYSHTKNPRPGSTNTKYVMFDLEDLEGLVRCIVWPEEFAKCSESIQADKTLALRGTVDRRPGSEETNIIVNEVMSLEDLKRRGTKGVHICIRETTHGPAKLEQLRELVAEYPGNCELQMTVCLDDDVRVHLKSGNVRVEFNAEFRSRVDELLGPGNIRTIAAPPPTAAPPPPRNGNFQRRAAVRS
jgi:DNA polymerase III subunit alpha